jgi:D-tyrosyl-tRNA(Tyr) deacylase
MRGLVQRVLRAQVDVDGECVGRIDGGLLVLVGVTHSDTAERSVALARKVHGLRILRGETSVADTPSAGILVVSQFTLYGALERGRRPSWSAAAPGAHAEPLVDAVVAELRRLGASVATGRFGADMQVDLINDGPITLLLEV